MGEVIDLGGMFNSRVAPELKGAVGSERVTEHPRALRIYDVAEPRVEDRFGEAEQI